MSISQTLLPEFDQEFANTRKLLQLVPLDDPNFTPHEKSMTLQKLAGHVAEMADWTRTTLTVDTLDLKPGEFEPFLPKTTTELLAHFDEHFPKARTAIESTTDQDWNKTWTMIWDGNKMFEMPRIACYRSMCLNHLIHHRAQLGVYLRLKNIAIPGMYGPSADEAQFWNPEKAKTSAA